MRGRRDRPRHRVVQDDDAVRRHAERAFHQFGVRMSEHKNAARRLKHRADETAQPGRLIEKVAPIIVVVQVEDDVHPQQSAPRHDDELAQRTGATGDVDVGDRAATPMGCDLDQADGEKQRRHSDMADAP